MDRYHTLSGVSFGGYPAAQIWVDFILWEAILNENPETKAIVELGTWQGGFSQYLAAQARIRGLGFVTYDATPPDRPVPWFVRADIFAEADSIISILRSYEPVALMVDNGNKPRELATFATALRDARSFVVVHDWGTEVQPEDVPDQLTPVYEEFCDDLGSLSRVFRIRS